jgi:hypothetical protein
VWPSRARCCCPVAGSHSRTVSDADADPARLARLVRDRVPHAAGRAGLSEPAARLHDMVLDEACVCLARIVEQVRGSLRRHAAMGLGHPRRRATGDPRGRGVPRTGRVGTVPPASNRATADWVMLAAWASWAWLQPRCSRRSARGCVLARATSGHVAQAGGGQWQQHRRPATLSANVKLIHRQI